MYGNTPLLAPAQAQVREALGADRCAQLHQEGQALDAEAATALAAATLR